MVRVDDDRGGEMDGVQSDGRGGVDQAVEVFRLQDKVMWRDDQIKGCPRGFSKSKVHQVLHMQRADISMRLCVSVVQRGRGMKHPCKQVMKPNSDSSEMEYSRTYIIATFALRRGVSGMK